MTLLKEILKTYEHLTLSKVAEQTGIPECRLSLLSNNKALPSARERKAEGLPEYRQ